MSERFPSLRTWRHRDGGRVIKVFGTTWQIELCFARRRRDRFGVLTPLTVTMHRWPRNVAEE